MKREDDELDFTLAEDLPELGEVEVERLRAADPRVVLWPIALEFEEEGDIPSELAPFRPRLHARREEIVAQHASPLARGDVFDTQVISNHTGELVHERRYRMLGRTVGTHNDWAVAERFGVDAELPALAEREPPRAFQWTLSQGGREVDADEVEAYSLEQALERALAQAFDGFTIDEPSARTPSSMRWDALAGGTVLSVEERGA